MGKGYWCFWARKRPSAAILRAPCGYWRLAKPVNHHPSWGALLEEPVFSEAASGQGCPEGWLISGSLLAFLSSCSDFLTLCSNKDPQAGAVSSAFTVNAAQWVGSRFRQTEGQCLRPWACLGLPEAARLHLIPLPSARPAGSAGGSPTPVRVSGRSGGSPSRKHRGHKLCRWGQKGL